MEGTLKYAYMMSGTPEDVKQKTDEYWDILPSYAAIKKSERAKIILKSVPDPEAAEWRPIREIVMTDESIKAARANSNRQS